jgi:Flp pilus assembly pilin Flp
MKRFRRRQLGQSSLEYALACAAIAFALGISMVDPEGALSQLLDHLREGYERYAFSMSLPH